MAGVHAGDYAHRLGTNTWPVEECAVVDSDLQTFLPAARTIVCEPDGAVLISTDGAIQRQMMRIKSPDAALLDRTDESIEYADWMGTERLIAAEIALQPDLPERQPAVPAAYWTVGSLLAGKERHASKPSSEVVMDSRKPLTAADVDGNSLEIVLHFLNTVVTESGFDRRC
ncbi:MAG: hypothetical protein ABEI98_00230 [Halorhabdus sp.]